jgi:hypothetical protein
MSEGTLSSELWADYGSIILSNTQNDLRCGMSLTEGNAYMYASQGTDSSTIDIYPKKLRLINRNNTIEVTGK